MHTDIGSCLGKISHLECVYYTQQWLYYMINLQMVSAFKSAFSVNQDWEDPFPVERWEI